jgi:hypothetical protein
VAGRGGGPAARDGGERGLLVVRSERRINGGAGKAGSDGGGTLLKGRGGEAAGPDWRAAPRPTVARPRHARAALYEQGRASIWRMGPIWQREGEGEETRGAHGPAQKRKRRGPSPTEQEHF